MSFGDLLILFIVVGIVFFWWQQDKLHRRALALAKTACDRADVQLLDDSVGLRRLRLRLRRLNGHFIIERHFGFEFSPSGAARYPGLIIFHGTAVHSVDLDLSRTLAD
ncbi:conserved hypothetical protein [Halothiobacillus neapolitanus c2]|uniref:DUF3301 domain-containing protein n=1 Tax=Halothiobacillus neapolitanus (strain ATCC 23641 / DSM 15147 / CIP 104769 / NCIMB 8539 / c2) TaxID=555778 RepID=D0L229_HALNC|nr:conserved hypothetical protein [Halothiobacillus neapolitanus c2]TDN65139.1 uncharacterized protein DUF3301 [Halothiobacillus neapolitanus]